MEYYEVLLNITKVIDKKVITIPLYHEKSLKYINTNVECGTYDDVQRGLEPLLSPYFNKILHPPLTYDDVERDFEPLLSPFLKQILHPPLTYDDVKRGFEPLLSPFLKQILHPLATYDDVQRGLEPLLSPFFNKILHPLVSYDDVQRGLEPLLSPFFNKIGLVTKGRFIYGVDSMNANKFHDIFYSIYRQILSCHGKSSMQFLMVDIILSMRDDTWKPLSKPLVLNEDYEKKRIKLHNVGML
ncbi:hypothetical protein YC2023_068833 [Brassica napus]